MSKFINLGKLGDNSPLGINITSLVDSRMLIQGNSGGGKSWLLRLLCERAAAHVPVIVLDPEGEFASLREKLDMVLVGSEGEIQTDLRSAGLLARKLIELEVSAVIDLYELKPYERREYVKLFLNSLIELPRTLWHPTLVCLDEAHKFCPEKGTGEAVSTQAVIDLMSLGRKRGYAGILATQRFSKLHNDAIAETNNVFIGRTWLDADQKRAGDYLGMATADRRSLRDLGRGEFYAFGPALSVGGVNRFTSAMVETTHPKPGERHKLKPPKASDAIKQIVSQLEDLPQRAEAEARDLAVAQKRIKELERELKTKAQLIAPPSPVKTIEKPVIAAAELNRVEKLVEQINGAPEKMDSSIKRISDYMNEAMRQFGDIGRELAAALSSINAHNQTTSLPQQSAHDSHPLRTSRPAQLANVRASAGAQPRSQSSSTSVLPVGEARILTAIAQHTQGVTREQLTILTGYKRSSRDAYIQRLSLRTYVTVFSDHIEATDEGVAALGSDFEPLPTGKALRDYWVQRLPGGERVLFEAILAAHPQAVNRDDLSAACGYKRSSRDAYLQRLTARKLIVAASRGEVKASDSLYT